MSETKSLSHIGTLALDRAWQAVLECLKNRDYEGAIDAMRIMAYTASDIETTQEVIQMTNALYQKINVETVEGMSTAETSISNFNMKNTNFKNGCFAIYDKLVTSLKEKHYLDYEGIKPISPAKAHMGADKDA
jgi:hypothetical protein